MTIEEKEKLAAEAKPGRFMKTSMPSFTGKKG